MEKENIIIKDSIGVPQQRQLFELTRELVKALNQDEFIQIVSVYENVINRLVKQAKEEGIDI